jgi:hypothetical protein
MPETRSPISAVPAKPWYASRTLWFNGVMGAATAAEAAVGMLQPVLGDAAYATLAFVLVVGNAALRALTVQPINARRRAADQDNEDPYA